MYIHVYNNVHVHSSCSAQPGRHEACICKCCPGCTATILLGVSNEMYAVIQLALHEHFTHAQQLLWKFRHV